MKGWLFRTARTWWGVMDISWCACGLLRGVLPCCLLCCCTPGLHTSWKWLENGLHQYPKGRGRRVAGVSLLALAPPGQLQHGPVHVMHVMSSPGQQPRVNLSIKPAIQLATLSSLCPSLQPPRGSCFLLVLFGVLPWEAQQIPRGCGSPGSQIPNPLPFPDPPRARVLPQHLFITPGAGQAVWFGIKCSLAGLLPATAVARSGLISHDRPFQEPWELGCPPWPQKAYAWGWVWEEDSNTSRV